MRTTLQEVPGFDPTPSPSIDKGAEAASLCRMAVDGDLQATAKLLRMIAPAVARSVRLVLGPRRPDAEDVIQQSLLAFIQALAGFRGDCHPAGFACRIAVNVALTARRKHRERRLSFVDPAELTDQSPLWCRDASDDELAAYRWRFLRDLLLLLPSEQAEVISLHVIVGHSLPEIAAATATPLNTVKSRLRLAKESLRRHLESDPVIREATG